MSDGSWTLRFLDPRSLKVTKKLVVRNGSRRVKKLNELEYINGQIFANVWYEDYILRISPRTGQVTGWIDLRNLHPVRERRSRDEVLNGIAYDAERDRLFVTGKNWPKLFELQLKEP